MKRFADKYMLMSWGVILIFTVTLFYLSAIFFWSSDSPFFALRFEMDGSDSYRKMEGVWDLFQSQCTHYMTWSGRFVCQSLVQFFCAFTERPVFEICNMLVWLAFIFLSLRLAGIKVKNTASLFMVVCMSFLIFINIPYDPPFMINYLWMGTLVMAWLNIFFSSAKKSAVQLALIFLLSILAGNSQESFSIPLSGALTVWIIMRRFRLNKMEWVAVAGFFIGALTVVAAPGNYVRLGIVMDENGRMGAGILRNIFMALPQICIALFLGTVTYKRIKDARMAGIALSTETLLLLLAALFSIVLAALLKFEILARVMIPMNIFLSVTAFSGGFKLRHERSVIVLLSIICAVTVMLEYRTYVSNNEKYSLITKLYHESESGVVVIPDEMFCKDDGRNGYYDLGFVIQERVDNPDKPFLKRYPESLTRIEIGNDTNFVMRIAPQAWLIGQSLTCPESFVIKKSLFPGAVDLPMSDRIIDASSSKELVIDTINNTVIRVYVNNRWYIEADVMLKVD